MNEELLKKNEEILKKISVIMFLSNEPLTFTKTKEILGLDNFLEEDFVKCVIELKSNLDLLGLTIIENKSKNLEYILSIKKEYSDISKKIRQDELEGDLTPSALQVLTICAYLGAATKSEISFVRGVQSTQSIRSLMTRGLLKKIGDKYILSIDALQKLGITKINELPEYESIKQDFTERLKEIISEEKEE